MAKQKKQQSRIKRTINWLKPTSFKKGALLFAIAFVAIGGGYMAYRAFALVSIVSQSSASKFVCYEPGCSIYNVRPTEKKPQYETKISTGKVAKVNMIMDAPWNNPNVAFGYLYKTRVCLSLHATPESGGLWANFDIDIQNSNVGGNTGYFYVPSSYRYSTYCMPWINVPAGNYGYGLVTVKNVWSAGPSDLWVSGAILQVDM